MMVEHPFVSTEALCVAGWAAEHLDPPQRHIGSMLFADTSRKQRTKQIIVFHTVVKRIDQPTERSRPAGPFEERGNMFTGHQLMLVTS